MLNAMTESEAKRRVLFVCTQNKVRSLTAEHLYRVRPDLEVKSCGTATFAKNQLTKELLKWAEVVFTFDDSQMEAIAKNFAAEAQSRTVVCLGLPDIFTYKSDALVVKLTAKLDPYLGRPNAKKCPRHSVFTQSKNNPAAGPTAPSKPKSRRSLVSNLLAAVGVGAKKPRPAK